MLSRRTVLVALVVIVVGGGGAFALGVVGAPSVEDVENQFAGVNDTTTLVQTDLTVDNPNPIGVDAGGVVVNYTVEIGGVELAAGQRDGISVRSGTQTVAFLTAMDNERIPEWWASHLQSDERSTLSVHVDARSSTLGRSFSATPVERTVETDVLSSFNSTETRAVDADLALVSDPVLYVNETAAWWGPVTAAESPMEMRFTVYNPRSTPYTITAVGYDVTMNDVDVGQGETDREHVIEPRSTETIDATAVLRNDNLDEWWVTHLENDQVTDLRVDFYVVVELPTGESTRVPLEEVAHTETIETDIFGNEESTQGGEQDGTSTDDSTDHDSDDADDTDDGGGDGSTTDGTSTDTTGDTPTEAADTADDDTPTDDETHTADDTTDDGTDTDDGDGGGLLDVTAST